MRAAARAANVIDFRSMLEAQAKNSKPPDKVLDTYLKVGLGSRQEHPPKSFEQLKQRELAWILYITEGYSANLMHALTVNCVTFNDKEKAVLGTLLSAADSNAVKLRAMLKRL